MADRTLVQAVEDASGTDPTRGYRFIPDAGVPGTHGVEETSEASFSFTAIERASARYGGALQALGLRKGDRVALILPANEDFVLCFLGVVRAGMVPVPLYPPSGPSGLRGYLEATRHIVARSGARAVLTTSRIKRLMGTVQAACPELQQVVAVEGIRESMEPLRAEKVGLDDVAFLQFTSGSTSRPKGVTVTHRNLATNVRCIMDQGLGASAEDVGVSWLPLYHDMGLIGFVVAPLMLRVPVVLVPPLLFLRRPVTWFQTISRHRGTISFAPNFAYALCMKRIRAKDLDDIDLSSWRVAGCGAEPIRPETLESFARTYEPVGFRAEALMPCYGLAEAALAVTFGAQGRGVRSVNVEIEALASRGEAVLATERTEGTVNIVSCGRPFHAHEVHIFATEDLQGEHPLAERRVGEIRVAGPSVMPGYWDDPESTRLAFAGPFLRTGDLGFLHEGELYLCGRIKEVIILNGRNYYPQDMEWEAAKVRGVRKGNVIAFGALQRGAAIERERVVVAFELDEEMGMAAAPQVAQAVRKAVQEGLGLSVDDVVPLPAGSLPKTSSGKLQRTHARALYEADALLPAEKERPRVEMAKQAALSQLSYLRLAVLGDRRR